MNSTVGQVTSRDCDVVSLVLHAHAARKDPSGAGVLFDLRTSLGYQVRIGSWANGVKIERLIGNVVQMESHPIVPEFLRQLSALTATHPLRSWADQIPRPVRQYAARFDLGQFEILRLLCSAPQAADLIPTNPVLLWLFSWLAAERGTPVEDIREIASWKRRDVTEWCGGINSQACVRTVEKFAPPTSRHWAKCLQRSIGNPDVIAFSAHSEAPFANTRLLREMPELRNLKAFHAEVNDATSTIGLWQIDRWIHDARRVAELLQRDVEQNIRDCPNAHALFHLHNRLVTDLFASDARALFEMSGKVRNFRRPPIVGTKDIEPITNTGELWAEGKFMRHCCMTHEGSVARGRSYFYRVLRPERATLEIGTFHGRAMIEELKLKFNAQPSEETYEFVREWLRSTPCEPAKVGRKKGVTVDC